MEPITRLAERLGAPVITTFKAKGQIADSHPLAAGVLGRSGTPVASWFMNEADLLLVMGASFSNHTGIYAGKPIIQIDFDPMQLGKFHSVEVPVWTKEQRAGEWDVWQTQLHNPDFSEYARICGALGLRVTERAGLDEALREALDHDGPAMFEVIADPDLV